MLLGFKSRSEATAFLAGTAAFVVLAGGWAYHFGFDRFAGLLATDQFSGIEAATILIQYRNSFGLFFFAVLLLLFAVAGTSISAERARRRNMKELIHWMRHRGCPIEESHDFIAKDEGMHELVKMIEELFSDESVITGRTLSKKEEIEDLKSRFLEIITHQLQTPLTSVRWNLDALIAGEMGELNHRQKEMLSITDRNYGSILTMIGDWVEALDVERGFIRMNFEALEVGKYVNLVVDDYQHQADAKGITIVKKIPRNLVLVRADKAKLIFVLKKLLYNAIAYTREKGRVEIRAKKIGDFVRIDVQDSGVGIPYDEQKWIFQKFFRASNATLIEPNASGVGLFVAKTLVEGFGGQIAFDSEEGEGATFVFTIPVAGLAEGVATHHPPATKKVSRMRRSTQTKRRNTEAGSAPKASVGAEETHARRTAKKPARKKSVEATSRRKGVRK